METLTKVFSCEICKIFKKTFFYWTPPMATSASSRLTFFLPSQKVRASQDSWSCPHHFCRGSCTAVLFGILPLSAWLSLSLTDRLTHMDFRHLPEKRNESKIVIQFNWWFNLVRTQNYPKNYYFLPSDTHTYQVILKKYYLDTCNSRSRRSLQP